MNQGPIRVVVGPAAESSVLMGEQTRLRGLICGVILAAIAGGLTLGSEVAQTGRPDGAERRVESLVEQLGAFSYDRRERAAQQLMEIGTAALPLLRNAAEHGDLEVRYRARQLLQAIEQGEQERILSEFLSGGDPSLGNFLPGWQRYSELVGHDHSARALFTEMYRAEPEIMKLTDQGGPLLRAAVEDRALQFRRSKQQSASARMTPSTAAVLLFVMLDPTLEVSGTAQSLMQVVLGQQALRDALLAPGESALQRLLTHWIADAEEVSPAQRISIAMMYGMEAGVSPARQLLRMQAKGSHIQTAIFTIAKLGGPDDLKELEPFLLDESVLAERVSPQHADFPARFEETKKALEDFDGVFPPLEEAADEKRPSTDQVAFSSQVRDVALAAAISMTGQNPFDYGFRELRPHDQFVYAPNTAGFASEIERARAFERWALWSRVQRSLAMDIDEIAVEGVGL